MILKSLALKWKYSKSNKIFCVGKNKTGTTSMAKLLNDLNFDVAPQKEFELLLSDWNKGDFRKIIRNVKYNGIAFQDIPFSLPNTFKVLDKKFPNSKFILTVRDSPEDWYKSLVTFHSKLFGNGKIPTKHDLQNAMHIHKGWMWMLTRVTLKTPEDDIYNEKIIKQLYIDYNNSVIEYFKNKPNKLLVINLKDPEVLPKLCGFLGVKNTIKEIPWENKT